MTTPSLVNIPAGYKSLKMYSQLPTDGVGDFDVARTDSPDGCATRVNSAGLIESVLSNVPRLDYSDSSCPVWLAEPSTTNLLLRSEEFDNASWSKLPAGTGSAPIVTANAGISPDGTQNADRVQFNLNGGTASGDVSVISQGATVTSAATTTKSIYIKSNDANDYNLNLYEGSVGGYTSVVAGQTWQRVDITNTVPATNSSLVLGLRNISGVVVDDTADILVWGGMLEEKSYATSYVKTTGATATRGADVIDGAGDVNTFNSSEGTLLVEISALADSGVSRNITLIGDVNNFVKFVYSSISNRVDFVCFSGGVVSCNIVETIIDTTINNKFALVYKQNNFIFFINGAKVGADLSGNAPVGLVELSFNNEGGTNPIHGKVKQIQVYKSALTDLEIESLTGFSSFSLMAEYLNYTIY